MRFLLQWDNVLLLVSLKMMSSSDKTRVRVEPCACVLVYSHERMPKNKAPMMSWLIAVSQLPCAEDFSCLKTERGRGDCCFGGLS